MNSKTGNIKPSVASPPSSAADEEEKTPMMVAVCRYLMYDQRSSLVCMRNPEAPGDCVPGRCPYGGPFP